MSSGPSTTESPSALITEERLRKRRKRTRWTIFMVAVWLVGLTMLENYFLQKQTSTPISNNIAVLALFNLILILLFVLLLLITRNLVKFYNERKSKILGSKFQTKLIIAFLILALVPSIFLFMVASKLFTYSIGSWFNIQVEKTLKDSMAVAQEYYSTLEESALTRAKFIEKIITRNELYHPNRRTSLQYLLKKKVDEYELGGIMVYDNLRKIVASETSPSVSLNHIEKQIQDLIQKSIDGEGVAEFRWADLKDFLVTVVPMAQTVEDKISIWGYIVTLTQIPSRTLLKIETIRNTFEDYKQQKFLKLPVSANYYITFLLITLLIIFSAIWLGFYMARGITVPIQQLAEGTRRIAGGDLNFKIDVRANDEISLLVDSFNQMTTDLNESRVKIERAHQSLQKSHTELDRRRNYIETIVENIGAGVVTIDKAGRVSTFNKAAQKILNMNLQEVIGSGYKDVFDPSFHEPIREMIRRTSESQKETLEEQMEIRVGETNLTLLVHARALRDADQSYLGLVILFEDLTQMIKAQKIAAWKEVAQGIAHEIKNPLTPIQLNTQRLRKKYHENKKDFARVFDESIAIISQEVEGMKDLLNEFVRFSRMPTPNPKPASLNQVIDDVILLYTSRGKNLEVVKNLDPRIGSLNIDVEQMRRVFINLFENAIHAMDESGKIQISTRTLEEENRVRIEFSDSGTGIAPEVRDKLFLPYYTTKKRGTGLGLAIVNRIILDHNGTIHVQANQPRGTVFVIELPFGAQKAATVLKPDFRQSSTPF